MTATILSDVERDYPDCLRDESRLRGHADSISFPRSEQDIGEIMARMHEAGIPVTVQGARTGITGGAVPDGGHVLNLAKMTNILGLRREAADGAFLLTVQPGLPLSEMKTAIAAKQFDTAGWSAASLDAYAAFREAGPWTFPPDPTETSATVGGMVACNASGACSFRYGPTRNYLQQARCVLADGSIFELRRGQPVAGRSLFLSAGGRTIAGKLPSYRMPTVKNAAGYYVADNMDVLDIFVGCEGTLAVFSELELRLVPVPGAQWGITVFLPSEENAIKFVQSIRTTGARPAAIEFFDNRALNLLRHEKRTNPAFSGIPGIRDDYHTAIYVEYHCANDDEACEAVSAMSEIAREHGGDENATWIADKPKQLERLKNFRHAVPEAVNLAIDLRKKSAPTITKLGTDMAVPDDMLPAMLRMYHDGLDNSGLEYVMFGHIGNNHIHVNVLPNDAAELERGKALWLKWADAAVSMGGSVSAEHGIGKLKTELLERMYGLDGVAQMRFVKRLFDERELLNRGNLWKPSEL